jgi:hypothetical protein
VSKLLDFDFTVEYKKGRENWVADALSRMEWPDIDSKAQQGSEVLNTDEQPTCKAIDNMSKQAISTLQPSWTRELTNSYVADQQLQQLIQQFQQRELDQKKYQYHKGLLFYKGRIHLGNLEEFQQQVLQ